MDLWLVVVPSVIVGGCVSGGILALGSQSQDRFRYAAICFGFSAGVFVLPLFFMAYRIMIYTAVR